MALAFPAGRDPFPNSVLTFVTSVDVARDPLWLLQ
jgi:hypothetical protein